MVIFKDLNKLEILLFIVLPTYWGSVNIPYGRNTRNREITTFSLICITKIIWNIHYENRTYYIKTCARDIVIWDMAPISLSANEVSCSLQACQGQECFLGWCDLFHSSHKCSADSLLELYRLGIKDFLF